MATFNSADYKGRLMQLVIDEVVNAPDNSSTLNWTLRSTGGTSNWYTVAPTTVIIDGVTVYSIPKTDWSAKKFPATLGSVNGSLVVKHNTDGKKTINVSFTTNVYVWEPSEYGGEMKLADFTDYLNPSDVASRARFAGQPMEKFENAASCARPHLALIPELAGDWFFRHGDLSSAEQRYFEALKLSPRRPGIYRRLARLACARGDFSSGAGLLKQAEKLFPRNPKYRLEHPENRVMFPADFTLKDLQ